MILVVVTLVALSTLATWPCEATPQGGWKAPSESDWTALLAGDIPYEEPETFTGEGNNEEENISRVGQSIEPRVSGESSNALLGPGSFGYRHAQHLRGTSRSKVGHREKQQFGLSGGSFLQRCGPQAFGCNKHDFKYRRPDGSCNNLQSPFLGQSEQPYRRLLARNKRVSCSRGSGLPNPRLASRLLTVRSEADATREVTMNIMLWGQMIDHDLMLTPVRKTGSGSFLDCCAPANEAHEDCCPIHIPRGDFFYGRHRPTFRPSCLPFIRSKMTNRFSSRCFKEGESEVQNDNTAWIDMSFLYGSTTNQLIKLMNTTGGALKFATDRRGRTFPPVLRERTRSGSSIKMQFGDTRGDVHPAFTLISNAFLRLHNQIAGQLESLNPGWGHFKVFNEARKIVSAVGQHITYTQFMDGLLGASNPVSTSDHEVHRNYYNSSIDPRITSAFSTAAFRLHTYVGGRFDLLDKLYRKKSSMLLRDVFHNPLPLLQNENHDDLIRGLAAQPLREFNAEFTPELTEWLFQEKPQDFGSDLVARNIQRGRDHQLQPYLHYRKRCGLGDAGKWEELADDLISLENVNRLRSVYRKPSDIDLYVGGILEEPMADTMLGPTMHCYVQEQFKDLRDGDRFFYTNPGQFTRVQLATIKEMTLSSVLCAIADRPNELWLPPNSFKRIQRTSNRLVHCNRHPRINLDLWRGGAEDQDELN